MGSKELKSNSIRTRVQLSSDSQHQPLNGSFADRAAIIAFDPRQISSATKWDSKAAQTADAERSDSSAGAPTRASSVLISQPDCTDGPDTHFSTATYNLSLPYRIHHISDLLGGAGKTCPGTSRRATQSRSGSVTIEATMGCAKSWPEQKRAATG